ncbi:patellin-4-like [Typha latifolia]|uniref:patellin-4-like n=1 Tax=Typha latifolia TaxID=4733 RepID=UPI003C2E1C8F
MTVETQMAEVVKDVAAVDVVESKNAEQSTPEEQEEKVMVTKEEITTLGSIMEKNSSFKEESNFLTDLKEHEKKALMELRSKVEDAILNNKFSKKEEEEENKDKEKETTQVIDKDINLWGVPLLPSKCPESNNVILLKFLRAREFKVKDAYKMLEKTLEWRKESKIDLILEEKSLGEGFEAACYMDGVDREGRPVCYNVYGVFQDEKMYEKAFGTEEKRDQFLRWRVQFMEKGIQELEFKPGSPASLVQVIDLKNSPRLSRKELRVAMKQAVEVLQNNYPEFVTKNIFINVPFWYYAFSALISPFLTQRTRSKFVFAHPWKVPETLLKYIPAENIPVSYGGLKREGDIEFSGEDGGVSELTIKSGSIENVEIPVPQVATMAVWDLTVFGWEVNYKEEFVPSDEGSYTIVIQKERKMGHQEETTRNSFKNKEPGKVVLTIENNTYKKKKVLFRYKTKHC